MSEIPNLDIAWEEDSNGNIIHSKEGAWAMDLKKLQQEILAEKQLPEKKNHEKIREQKHKETLKESKKVHLIKKKVQSETTVILETPEKVDKKISIRDTLKRFKESLSFDEKDRKTIDLKGFHKHVNKLGKDSIMAMMLFGNSIKEKGPIQIKDTMAFSARNNLRDAWEKKIKLYGWSNPGLEKYYKKEVLPYVTWKRKMTPISREVWDTQIEEAIKKVRANLEIEKIFIKNPKKQDTLRKLIWLIGPAEMNSITFAELIDSTKPIRNEVFFNTILENAGPEFLAHFPALWDPYLSFGSSQLTDFAVWPDGGIWLMQRKYMKASLVPNDMRDIKIEDHHEWWYIFTIFNLKELLENSTDSQVAALNNALIDNPSKTKNQLIQYIAAAHNKPTEARKQFRNWIDDELVGKEFRTYLKSPTTKNNADKAGKNHTVQVALL